MRKRGQAATEFLTTYGWAILIVLFAVGAVVGLGLFDPKVPNSCSINLPFVCQDVVFREGGFEATVTTNSIRTASLLSNEIRINGLPCLSLKVNNNPSGDLNLSNGVNKITCYQNINSIKEGIKVNADFNLTYTSKGSSIPHKTSGNIKGKVEKGSYINNFDSSVVLSLNFDNDNSTTAIDSSSFGNNGRLSGNPNLLQGANCVSGGCYNFDGVTDSYILSPSSSSLNDIKQAVTIEFWMKSDSSQTSLRRNALGKYGSFIIRSSEDGGGRPIFYAYTEGSPSLLALYLNQNVYDNVWHHIVFTYDTQVSTNKQKGYIDGVLINSANGGIGLLRIFPLDGIMIGREITYPTQKYGGYLDNMRIYNRALTLEEIKQHYDSMN